MANRNHLLESLENYKNTWGGLDVTFGSDISHSEFLILDQFVAFINSNPRCFWRENISGHMTGSAMVFDPTSSKVLLTHHRKLNLWLQLGGHADGHHILHDVALTEAHEESGLNDLELYAYEADVFNAANSHPIPFDIDCHVIPARSNDPAHLHFDVRFLIACNADLKPKISEESHAIQWFTLDEGRTITNEPSMIRQFDKVEWLINQRRLTSPLKDPKIF